MAASLLWAALAIGSLVADSSGTSSAPTYTADSIANTASSIANFYAPDTFISIYGQNLAYVVKSISQNDIAAGSLPTALIGTGVRVLINQIPANLWYVSPTLVNILIPASLVAGPATLQLEVDGLAGPPISIMLGATAPSMFQIDATTVLAVHGDGSIVTSSAPARKNEEIAIYATGLGPTTPAAIPNQVPQTAARLVAKDFQVELNGVAIASSRINYAGATPGYAGLFQINITLPPDAPSNPEIRAGSGGILSPPGRFLPLQ